MNITYEVKFTDHADPFTNSREALKSLLEARGHQISSINDELELINFKFLKNFDSFITTISHTRGAGAAALANKSDLLAIGIDIEWSTRLIKTGAQKFFVHPQDVGHESELELWTMKEAAFKALSPLEGSLAFPGVLVLSKIVIQHNEFWTLENPKVRGHVECIKKQVNSKTLFISLAEIKK